MTNDAALLLAAGTPAGWGVALVAGTGSIAFGRDGTGRTAQLRSRTMIKSISYSTLLPMIPSYDLLSVVVTWQVTGLRSTAVIMFPTSLFVALHLLGT